MKNTNALFIVGNVFVRNLVFYNNRNWKWSDFLMEKLMLFLNTSNLSACQIPIILQINYIILVVKIQLKDIII